MTALADLRALAEQATPGPWKAATNCVAAIDGPEIDFFVVTDALIRDAAFIAACDPQTVLALVEVAEAAHAYTAAYDVVGAIKFTAEDDNASMQAVIREPVAARKAAHLALRAALAGLGIVP